MFMMEGVVLNSSSAMQETSDGFPPVTLFPPKEPKKPRPPVGASSFSFEWALEFVGPLVA